MGGSQLLTELERWAEVAVDQVAVSLELNAGEWWPIQRWSRSTLSPDSISSDAHVCRSAWNPTPDRPARSAAGTSTRRRSDPTSAGTPVRPGKTGASSGASGGRSARSVTARSDGSGTIRAP